MKKPILCFLVFLGFHLSVAAQEVKPEVISTAGGTYEASGGRLSWTLGEPSIASYTSGNAMLTQGYQQTGITVESGYSDPVNMFSIKVYPVPSTGTVTLEFSEIQKELTVEVYNLQGIRMSSEPILSAKMQVDLKAWPSSEYILKIISSDNKLIQTYTIIKN